jgi:hypothetical protein
MKKLISLLMLLFPCAALAGTDCRVVEFADHYEAICSGNASQAPATPQRSAQEPITVQEQEQTAASGQTPEQGQEDVPIIRNELARQHASLWLRTRPGQ